MPASTRRWQGSRGPWRRSWSGVQTASHVAVFYSIGSFAALIQPTLFESGGALEIVLLSLFWFEFVVCFALYCFVCTADTAYHKSRPCTPEFEPRRCELCDNSITQSRVKHCQVCGKCIAEFDHHCRYLNVCVGGRTYRPWFCFVAGLLVLMVACAYGAVGALASRESSRFALAARSETLFNILVILQAVASGLVAIFLICLLGQHVYFIFEGITTLEYIKDQPPGFPSLPPQGWREAIRRGECHACFEELEATEVKDQEEVWFCTICQADIGRAGVEFLSCDSCENVNVCPVCRRVAWREDSPVVTYRVATLRKRAADLTLANGDGSVPTHRSLAHSSSFSSQRETSRLTRRTFSAALASVEGHAGDGQGGRRVPCGKHDEEGQDMVAEESDSSDTGDSVRE